MQKFRIMQVLNLSNSHTLFLNNMLHEVHFLFSREMIVYRSLCFLIVCVVIRKLQEPSYACVSLCLTEIEGH